MNKKLDKKNKEKKYKKVIVSNEYIMRNRYLTRFMALVAVILAIVFTSIYVYDRFVVNHSCYTFYLEVKDKDLQERILTNEEIMDRIDKVCMEYDTGYTVWIGKGGYIGDERKMLTEDTYILRINNLNETIAKEIARAFIKGVNSSACMIEENRSKAEIVYRD